ncbi:MAG: Amidophosphoribosyltransferase [Planctomycetes bacterium]|nr:Amidophosphoribosyltransferase [Planctomycetota bacterium]
MCGVIGVLGNGPVIGEIVDGLLFLQHRGQDAAGAATYDGQNFRHHRGMGLVREVFDRVDFSHHKGRMGVGHVRYPTIGGGSVDDAQPFVVNSPFGIAMAHNGNLTNFKALKQELKDTCRRHVGSSCDVEVILNVFADELAHLTAGRAAAPDSPETLDAIFDAVRGVFARCKGSYSVVCVIAGVGMLAFRDPFGIKPLVYGHRAELGGNRWMVSSESCALISQGFRIDRDLKPGEAMLFRDGGAPVVKQVTEGKHHLCIFEFIYFARPDSEIDGISVYKARMRLGSALARRWKDHVKKKEIEIDTVIPVPDSSRPAAQQMAAKIQKPFREGLLKNRYIGRTFIMPGDANRKKGIRYKLSPVRLEIKGKSVLLVDDSIVRGTTSKAIIQMVRETGAREVHMASSCPPLRYPCVYGVDMSTRSEFIAKDRDVDGIRTAISADSLLYQEIGDMVAACRPPNEQGERRFCMACMDGQYPTGDITPEVLNEIEGERLAAGSGVQ